MYKNFNRVFKKILLPFFVLSLFVPQNFILAQTENVVEGELNIEEEVIEEFILEPIIKSENDIRVDKKIIFDATNSNFDFGLGEPSFHWDFGDGYWEIGNEVVHQYNKVGRYEIKLTINQNESLTSVVKEIFVYDKKVFFITDEETGEEINLIEEQAAENGVALKLLLAQDIEGFLNEDNLAKSIGEETEFIKDSDMLIFYTKSSLGLQSFTHYFRNLSEAQKELLQKKFFIKISDSNLDVALNVAYQSFNTIQPEFILLTRVEAINPLFVNKDYTKIIDILKGRGVEYQIIDEHGKKPFFYFLSHLISNFISRGVSANTVYLILIIPFLTFITIFSRQVIGLSTFGVYAPVMIAASFYILGLELGLLTFFFVVTTGYFVKYIMNKFELLYLPKVALNISFISLSFLIVVWLFLWFDTSLSLSLAIFPMLVMSTVSEKFMAAQSEEGFKGAMFGVLETLLVVIVSYYLITWVSFNNIIMSWPELVFVPFVLNFLLGKFAGLRLGEYFRFRSLFSEHNEE